MVFSTYLGGSGTNEMDGIALNRVGDIYVTGKTSSTDFPTVNAFQPTYGGGLDDAYVAEFNPTGSALIYATYLRRQRL